MRARGVLRVATLALLVAATYILDRITGLQPDLTVLYLVPVVLATSWYGLQIGLAIAVVALGAEVFAHPLTHLSFVIPDAFAHLAVFGFAAVVTSRLEAQLREIQALKKRRDREIDIARSVQESVAEYQRPDDSRFEIESRVRPARELGGDYLLARETSQGVFLCVADISGKGLSAALFTALLEASLTAALESDDDPGRIVGAVNAQMYRSLPDEMFVTIFCAMALEDELRYCNAGHEPGMLLVDGTARVRELFSEDGVPVGVEPELVMPTTSVGFPPGAMLLCVTDGVTDAPAFGGDFHRLEDLFERELQSGATGVADAVFQAVTEDGVEQRDDVTVLVVRRREAKKAVG